MSWWGVCARAVNEDHDGDRGEDDDDRDGHNDRGDNHDDRAVNEDRDQHGDRGDDDYGNYMSFVCNI